MPDEDEDHNTLKKKIDELNNLAWDLRDSDTRRSRDLSEQAYNLCSAFDEKQTSDYRTYPCGQAASLRNLGYLNLLEGDFRIAISQSRKALDLLMDEPPAGIDVEVLRNLGHAYLSLGKYAAAMETELKALKLAQELKDREREAFVLDAIGGIYAGLGRPEQALEVMQDVFDIYRELALKRGEAVTLNNIAWTQCQAGLLNEALESATASLVLAQEIGLASLEEVIYSTIAEIYLEMKHYDQAIFYGTKFLVNARENEQKLFQVWALTILGKTHHANGADRQALPFLEESLEMSRQAGLLVEQAECLEILSDVFERQRKLGKALVAFKQFHALRELIYGRDELQKIGALESIDEIESFKKEAEKFYRRSLELQKQVEEQRKAQAALEEMATLDPLTGLLNRRQFFMRAEQVLETAYRKRFSASVVMMDIDNFKMTNDSHGHIVGDRVLIRISEYLQSCTRATDLICRYGGDEFAIFLPETNGQEASKIAERLRNEISSNAFTNRTGCFSVSVSIGVSDLTAEAQLTLDQLLDMADQALYVAKQAGRNQVTIYQNSSFACI
jgi:diguanylate cyclase (GGDEF)-like protein